MYFSTCNVEYLGFTTESLFPYPLDGVFTCTRGPVLPVTFGSITGYLQNGIAAISWKVLTQINVREYIIEKSDNGSQFYTAGTVPANQSITAEYNWKDIQPLSSMAWYRIKAIDMDGKIKYSSIIKLAGTKNNSFTIYPNPVVNRSFIIRFDTPFSGQTFAHLYSIEGRKVWTTRIDIQQQSISNPLNIPSYLPAGLYALVIDNNHHKYTLLLK